MNNKYRIVIAITVLFFVAITVSALVSYWVARNTPSSQVNNLASSLFPSAIFTLPFSSSRPVSSGLLLNKKPTISPSTLPSSVAIIPPQKATPAATGCGIAFTVNSGFNPTKCELKNVTPGQSCGEPGKPVACPSSHELVASGSKSEVQKISISSFKLREGSFSYGNPAVKDDFLAMMISSQSHTANLKTGKMTLKLSPSGMTAEVTLDLLFVNGARVSGSGEVPRVDEVLP